MHNFVLHHTPWVFLYDMENKMTTAQNINDKLFIMDYSWITESCLKQEGIFSMALHNFIILYKRKFQA